MNSAFRLQNVEKKYDAFFLEALNLDLPTGEIMGLVGANGAGKSTILRILMGLIRADSGVVEVLGNRLPEAQVLAKQQIGYASEDMRLYKTQSLRWHMDFIASIYPDWDENYAIELVKRFDLRPLQILRGYSHGQRVKAMLLLNLARRPKLLLLDEPTTGLDPVARSEVLEALAEVLRDEQRSVLFSSHNTKDIEQLADSITFIHQGKLIASADKESFIDNWRRIVCAGIWRDEFRQIADVAAARHSGSIIEFKVRRYQPELAAQLATMGLSVTQIEHMDLEDIFVTSVRSGAVQ